VSTYYVDPAAGGANNGSSWGDAWTTVQSAFDTATAGDTVYCRGTQTLAANIDVDTNAGSAAGGHIKFIGCDAAGTPRAGQFTLDANSAAAHCLDVSGAIHRIWIENFTMKNATSYNFASDGDASDKANWVIKRCVFELSASGGAYTRYLSYPQFVLCVFRNNGQHGCSEWASLGSRFIFCTFHGNNNDGVYIYGSCQMLYGCLAYDNGNAGIDLSGYKKGTIINCVLDDNDDGIEIDNNAAANVIVGCRISNNRVYGIDQASAGWQSNTEDWCVFYNNGAAGAGHRNNIAVGSNSLTAANADQVGYRLVRYVINFNNGAPADPNLFQVGEVITTVGGKSGILTAVSDAGANGTLTYRAPAGGMFANADAITGGSSAKAAQVNGSVGVVAGPDYSLVLGAAGYRTEVDVDTSRAVFAPGLPNVPIVKTRN